MHILTTTGDPRIYLSTNIEFVLKPRKLEFTKLNNFTVYSTMKYATHHSSIFLSFLTE